MDSIQPSLQGKKEIIWLVVEKYTEISKAFPDECLIYLIKPTLLRVIFTFKGSIQSGARYTKKGNYLVSCGEMHGNFQKVCRQMSD